MAVERTLSIIKPDATRRNLTGKINARFEERGLRIVAHDPSFRWRSMAFDIIEVASGNSCQGMRRPFRVPTRILARYGTS